MSHVRTTIRQAVVATLIAASTAAGSRVFDHPYNPRKTFPALVVEDLGANFSESNITEAQAFMDLNGNVERRYRFAVIAEIQQSDAAAAERDDLIAEVEVALFAASIDGVQTLSLIDYQSGDDNTGDKPIRRGLQIFEALYVTPAGDPTSTTLL